MLDKLNYDSKALIELNVVKQNDSFAIEIGQFNQRNQANIYYQQRCCVKKRLIF